MIGQEYPEDWQEQGWCCRPCAVAAWRASPGDPPPVTVNPDEVLERMLAAARRRPDDPLAADLLVFHRLMLERLPWPTAWEERRVEDVPLDGPGGLRSGP